MAIEIKFDFVIDILVILFFYHKHNYHNSVIAIDVIFFFYHKLIYHKAGIENIKFLPVFEFLQESTVGFLLFPLIRQKFKCRLDV